MNYTKLRYIKSKDANQLVMALQSLKFKVEVKELYFAQGFHWIWFTLSETDQFENVEI